MRKLVGVRSPGPRSASGVWDLIEMTKARAVDRWPGFAYISYQEFVNGVDPNFTFGRFGEIGEFIVPADETYRITAIGARGGMDTTGVNAGGLGVKAQARFELRQDMKIRFIVGQRGLQPLEGSRGGGGGGGTFVWTEVGGEADTLLLVAGGGGGGGNYAIIGNAHASVTRDGRSGTVSNSGVGGVDGHGGAGGTWSGGGGGWLSSGASANNSGAITGGVHPSAPSHQNPGYGGEPYNSNNGEGGFGAGGGAYAGGGGGGGFSGGGGGGWSIAGEGGGGGSFVNDSAITDFDLTFEEAVPTESGQGLLVIESGEFPWSLGVGF